MKDQDKTKTQLIDELAQLRQRLAECESSEAKRRGTEEERRRSEEQLRLVIDAMPALISYVDSEQCYRLSNKVHEQWFGYGPGEAKGCHIKEVLGEDVYKEIKQHVEMALSGKQATYETKVSHRDGGTRHVVVTYVPDFTAQGEVRGFFGLATDITERKQAERELQEAHNELERRVEERTAELAKANEQLRQEIAERKQAEEELRESKERLQVIFNSMQTAVVIIDAESHMIVDANPVAIEMIGVHREEIIGRVCHEFICPAEKGKCPITDLGQSIDKSERVLINARGEVVSILKTVIPIVLDGSTHLIDSFIDITERKRAEEALRESEEFSRSLMDNAPNPIMVINADTSVRYVNPALEELTGFSSEELVSCRAPYPWWTEETADKTGADLAQAMDKGAHKLEELFQKKDGERFWVEITSTSVRSDGEFKYYLANWVDITERKQAEEELRASEEKYRALVEDINEGFMVVRGSKVLFANRSAAEAIGRPVEDIIGGPYLENLTPASLEKSRHIYQQTKSGEPPHDHEDFELQREDGTTVFVAVRFKETVYKGERAYLLLVRDITERKQAEEKIRAFQSRLRSLASRLSLAEERERKRLAAGVHDQIGQPLAVLQMKLGILREPLSSIGLEKQLDEIRELVGHMIQNARSLTFELSPPILYELGLEPALDWLVEQVQAEHGLVGRFEDDGQTKPLGDDARGFVFWVVRELLMNVIKHARAQAVTVSVCRDDGELRMVVEDNGVGFDTSEMEKRARGFGLFSIRERLTEFGGQVEVESELGRGTRVILVVPLESGGESAGGN